MTNMYLTKLVFVLSAIAHANSSLIAHANSSLPNGSALGQTAGALVNGNSSVPNGNALGQTAGALVNGNSSLPNGSALGQKVGALVNGNKRHPNASASSPASGSLLDGNSSLPNMSAFGQALGSPRDGNISLPNTSAFGQASVGPLSVSERLLNTSALGQASDYPPNGSRETVVSAIMYEYADDCGKESPLDIQPPAFLQTMNVPGAGIKPVKPAKTVLKDGFMAIDCVKDYMFYRGDKYGDNKHDYKLGSVAGVSIVHYDAYVSYTDQAPMTPRACFEFCRTVPNMGFFGIVNGRDCYCTPYFKPMAGDSSQCDSVCEGDQTTMCGGKTKSSVFAMHMCASTEEDLSQWSSKAGAMMSTLDAKIKTAKEHSENMQKGATTLQKSFGAVGDSAATGLMQDAKVFAGTLLHKAEEADTIRAKLNILIKAAAAIPDFSDPAHVSEADSLMEEIQESNEAGAAAIDDLDSAIALASPENDVIGAAEQYYPVMYFVHRRYQDVPTSCGGDAVGEPIVSESSDGCASACDANIHSCVAFQYFGGAQKLCFLFSKLTDVSYYTGCGKSFLQIDAKAAPFEVTCFAKLSKFEGTSLRPDPQAGTGLQKLTKADRCFK